MSGRKPFCGTLAPSARALKRATKQAVEAAGGLEAASAETGKSRSQLARCTSPHDADMINLADALALDELGLGMAGAPFILRAFARQMGFAMVSLGDAADDVNGLMSAVVEIAAALGDASHGVADAQRDGIVTAQEAQALLGPVDHLADHVARLRAALVAIARLEARG